MKFLGDILVGFIGRPILTLIKWLRWPLLGFGIYFNAINTYDPVSGLEWRPKLFNQRFGSGESGTHPSDAVLTFWIK